MEIVGAFNFPHGTIPFDPQTRDLSNVPAAKPTTKEESIRIHHALRKTAAALVNSRPDLIIMTTPHGLKVSNNYVFYSNPVAKGSAEWDGLWADYTADIKIDTETSGYLVRELRQQGHRVEEIIIGLPLYSSAEPLPLRWAEVVPWWFITEEAKKANWSPPKAVIISLPYKFFDKKEQHVSSALKLGRDMHALLKNADFLKSKKVALVTSIDLSHNHSKSETSPYPYVPTCEDFDRHQVNWAKLDITTENIDKSNEELLTKAARYVDSHHCCGYMGLVTVQGIFSCELSNGVNYSANFVDYAVPTYYGMMASYFLRK